MSPDDLAVGKKSSWYELEITGEICNLSPRLWDLDHLTSLYLNKNKLILLPPEISRLHNLKCLDISDNKLCSLPPQLGDMVHLRELLLNNNNLQHLPFEMGKLFNLQTLGLKGNPLPGDIMSIYTQPGGVQKLLTFLLDNLNCE